MMIRMKYNFAAKAIFLLLNIYYKNTTYYTALRTYDKGLSNDWLAVKHVADQQHNL